MPEAWPFKMAAAVDVYAQIDSLFFEQLYHMTWLHLQMYILMETNISAKILDLKKLNFPDLRQKSIRSEQMWEFDFCMPAALQRICVYEQI